MVPGNVVRVASLSSKTTPSFTRVHKSRNGKAWHCASYDVAASISQPVSHVSVSGCPALRPKAVLAAAAAVEAPPAEATTSDSTPLALGYTMPGMWPTCYRERQVGLFSGTHEA